MILRNYARGNLFKLLKENNFKSLEIENYWEQNLDSFSWKSCIDLER